MRSQKGKMQEWLNWPAWKASKPQKGFGGSNPPLSAKRNGARRCRTIGIFCFIPAPLKLVCTGRRGETKMVDLSTSCEVKFCKEPHGECGERRVAHRTAKSIPLFPQNETEQEDVGQSASFVLSLRPSKAHRATKSIPLFPQKSRANARLFNLYIAPPYSLFFTGSQVKSTPNFLKTF